MKKNLLLVPNYRKANFANIRRKMESVNWNQCLENNCINVTYETFTANLKSIVNENIPYKPGRINICQALWMTDSSQKMVPEKRKAYKKFKLSQLTSDYNSYEQYEVRISHEAKKNSNLFFSYIRNKNNVRNSIGLLVDNDNKLISDDKDMASMLNSTFSRVFTDFRPR